MKEKQVKDWRSEEEEIGGIGKVCKVQAGRESESRVLALKSSLRLRHRTHHHRKGTNLRTSTT